MTAEKITKLRELADRGVGGEKENAKAILTRLGIDWRKPKESIVNTVKQAFGGSVRTDSYVFDIKYGADLLFLMHLCRVFAPKSSLSWISSGTVAITCTQSQVRDIIGLYNKHRDAFTTVMERESIKYFDQIMKKY